MESYRQGLTPMPGFKFSAGIAYVALPTDIDRAAYIADCYKNSYISIICDDGSFMNRIHIDPEILNFIEFPEKPEEMGSPLVYVTEPMRNQPIIVARLNRTQELGDLKEHQFKFRRTLGDQFVEITGSPSDRSISITVDGAKNKGTLTLNVFNQSDDGELNIEVQGNVNIRASKDTLIQQEGIFAVRTIDEEGEEVVNIVQSNEGHSVTTPKIKINNGGENFVLGQKLKSFLNDLISEISKATVTTALGQMPLLNATQIAAFQERIPEVLSEVAYIDK